MLVLVVASAYFLLSNCFGNPHIKWQAPQDDGGVDEASVEPAFQANPERQESSSLPLKSILVQKTFLHAGASTPIAAKINNLIHTMLGRSIVMKPDICVTRSNRC